MDTPFRSHMSSQFSILTCSLAFWDSGRPHQWIRISGACSAPVSFVSCISREFKTCFQGSVSIGLERNSHFVSCHSTAVECFCFIFMGGGSPRHCSCWAAVCPVHKTLWNHLVYHIKSIHFPNPASTITLQGILAALLSQYHSWALLEHTDFLGRQWSGEEEEDVKADQQRTSEQLFLLPEPPTIQQKHKRE